MPPPGSETRGARFVASGRKKLPSSPRPNRTGSSSCLKEPAFESGVGFGALYTLISSQQEFQRLNNLLEQTESLVKEMKQHLQHHERKLKSCSCSTCPDSYLTEIKAVSEQGSMSYIDKAELLQNYDHMRNSHDVSFLEDHDLVSEGMRNARVGCQMEDQDFTAKVVMTEQKVDNSEMSALEVELEAELELLEFNLNITEPDPEQALTDYSYEVDSKEVIDIMQNDRISYKIRHTSDSDRRSMQSINMGALATGYCVSPSELDHRLREVLEAQQKERIIELEELLREAKATLHAKEHEILYWKNCVHELTNSFLPNSEASKERKYLSNLAMDGTLESKKLPPCIDELSDHISLKEPVDLVKVVTQSHTNWHMQGAGIDTPETTDRRIMKDIEVHTPLPTISTSFRGSQCISRASERNGNIQQGDLHIVTSPSCSSSTANSSKTCLRPTKNFCSRSSSSQDTACGKHNDGARIKETKDVQVHPYYEPMKLYSKGSTSKYPVMDDPSSGSSNSKFVAEVNSYANSDMLDLLPNNAKRLHSRTQSPLHSATKTPRSSKKKNWDLHIVTTGLRRSYKAEESSISSTSPVLGKIRHWEALGRGQSSLIANQIS